MSYKERDHAALAASGAKQICPRRDVQDWPVTGDDGATFKEIVLVGATAHKAQGIVKAAARTSCTAAQLLRAQGLSCKGLEVEGRVLHCQPLPFRGPWECWEGGVTNPAPPGHVLRLRWRREAQDGDEDMDRVD